MDLGVEVLAVDGEHIASVVVDGELVTRDDCRIALDDVHGILVRPEGRVTSAESSRAFELLLSWTEITPARVLNRPSAAASNRSKPY